MKAVCDIFGWRYSGILAWLTWLFVHLMQIVQFENRLLVLVQWASHYITRKLICQADQQVMTRKCRVRRALFVGVQASACAS